MPASAALSHLTVLDLTRARAGPTAVRQLADWGADVIKIEMPPGVEGGEVMGGREASDFQNLQRNKRGMTLNLKAREGVEILKKLAARADVLVENYRPDVKQRLGIGYEALSAINPRLVYASISGYGEDGPYRERPGLDQIAQGMSGLMSVTGLPGQGPVRAGIAIADMAAGIFASYGILLALLERERSGRGQWVTTSLLAAQIFLLDFQAARWLMDGEVPRQAGNHHPLYMPTNAFRTRDGYVNIAATSQRMWRALCAAIGAPELVEHPDYAAPALRSKNRDALCAALNLRLETRTTAEWVDVLNSVGIPCGPIYSIDQTFADPQVRHLGMAQSLDKPGKGPVTYLGQPVRLSRTPNGIAVHPPELGEHTDTILRDLGYSDAEVASLRDRRIV